MHTLVSIHCHTTPTDLCSTYRHKQTIQHQSRTNRCACAYTNPTITYLDWLHSELHSAGNNEYLAYHFLSFRFLEINQ